MSDRVVGSENNDPYPPALLKTGNGYRDSGDHQNALKHYQQALIGLKKSGDRAGEAVALYSIADVYRTMNDFGRALELYQQSLSIQYEIDDRAGEARTLSSMADVYINMGSQDKALELYEQALLKMREVGDRAGEAAILRHLGVVFGNMGQYDQAIELLTQALSILAAAGERSGEAAALSNLAGVYLAAEDPVKALELFEKALSIYQVLDDRSNEADTLNKLGDASRETGSLEKALDFYQRALSLMRAVGNTIEEPIVQGNIYELHDLLDKAEEIPENNEVENAPVVNQSINIVEINKPARPVNDHPGGGDKLNYQRYASVFSQIICNPEMVTPFTIGIFGEWGAGKSFLMGKIKENLKNIDHDQKSRKWFEKIGSHVIDQVYMRLGRKAKRIDVHVIDFNAWVYSGSEHLWASLVTHLYRDIEKHFGVKAHWLRLGKAIRKSLPKALGVFLFYGLLGLGFSFLLDYNTIQGKTNTLVLTADAIKLAITNAVVGSLIGGSALASLPALWAALREFFDSLFLSRANKLQNLAAKPDFRNQIGIMADIKDEIRFIRELLKTGKNGKPTRLVLFIDDLDRCEPRKAVEVLQAIMLLLADEDGSPFVIFLGIDARVIVRAIEENYGEVLVKAGINGYEYLDKIIQVPFVIPVASQSDVDNYVESLLWASDNEKETVGRKMTSLMPLTPVATELVKVSESAIPQREMPKPQLPTAAAMLEAEPQAKKEPVLATSAREEVSVTFTQVERTALKACTAELNGNPRKIKRIINIYRLARLIMPSSIEQSKAVRWILMTEQWPLHCAWIIEQIENDAQIKKIFAEKSIRDVYKAAKKNIHSKAMEPLLGIDADPNLFEQFIQNPPVFSVQEIKTLLPYTFNLNPAIRSEVSQQALKLTEIKPTLKKKTVRAKAATGAKSPTPKKAVVQPSA